MERVAREFSRKWGRDPRSRSVSSRSRSCSESVSPRSVSPLGGSPALQPAPLRRGRSSGSRSPREQPHGHDQRAPHQRANPFLNDSPSCGYASPISPRPPARDPRHKNNAPRPANWYSSFPDRADAAKDKKQVDDASEAGGGAVGGGRADAMQVLEAQMRNLSLGQQSCGGGGAESVRGSTRDHDYRSTKSENYKTGLVPKRLPKRDYRDYGDERDGY